MGAGFDASAWAVGRTRGAGGGGAAAVVISPYMAVCRHGKVRHACTAHQGRVQQRFALAFALAGGAAAGALWGAIRRGGGARMWRGVVFPLGAGLCC